VGLNAKIFIAGQRKETRGRIEHKARLNNSLEEMIEQFRIQETEKNTTQNLEEHIEDMGDELPSKVGVISDSQLDFLSAKDHVHISIVTQTTATSSESNSTDSDEDAINVFDPIKEARKLEEGIITTISKTLVGQRSSYQEEKEKAEVWEANRANASMKAAAEVQIDGRLLLDKAVIVEDSRREFRKMLSRTEFVDAMNGRGINSSYTLEVQLFVKQMSTIGITLDSLGLSHLADKHSDITDASVTNLTDETQRNKSVTKFTTETQSFVSSPPFQFLPDKTECEKPHKVEPENTKSELFTKNSSADKLATVNISSENLPIDSNDENKPENNTSETDSNPHSTENSDKDLMSLLKTWSIKISKPTTKINVNTNPSNNIVQTVNSKTSNLTSTIVNNDSMKSETDDDPVLEDNIHLFVTST
jgi:hypothetical protein